MGTPTLSISEYNRSYKIAFGLALFTIGYNIVEGLVSTYFGFQDESLALFGFGTDSFIEVISGLGIAYMILRIQKRPTSNRDSFERRALRITGFSFYILFLGLVITSFYNMWNKHQPITTFYGVVISAISILVMLNLVAWKKHVGNKVQSDPILADAKCTMVCVYMSIILLMSSVIYEWANIPYIDSIGTLGLSFFAFKEGKECFAKSKGEKYCECE